MVIALLALMAQAIRLEAESGAPQGTVVAHDRRGFSGNGYVTGFNQPGDQVTWKFKAKPGMYQLRARYSSPNQPKGYESSINGHGVEGMLKPTRQDFTWDDLSLTELSADNEVVWKKGWGYYDLDALEFVPSLPHSAPKPVPNALVNHAASPEARFAFMSLRAGYGSSIKSGVYDEKDVAYVKRLTDRAPLILGGDLMDYSPSRIEHGAKPDDVVSRMTKASKQHMITLSWHWNAPAGLIDNRIKDEQGREVDARWYKGFYANATTFDVAKALNDPHSRAYGLLVRDIDAIARPLALLRDAHVPVLWRPLHEAEGRWFWWGARGPEPFKQLWRLMYTRLTKVHRLNNLIWVYSSGTNPAWYPGDDVVDVVGVDAYPSDHSDPLEGTWRQLQRRFDGRKLLAITEFGGVPDPERMFRFGACWSYWVSWTGNLGPNGEPPKRVRDAYLWSKTDVER